ncbi:AAA family ATPase [soil metagenome]
MKLIRVTLTDFRGVASSSVEFAAPGVTIVIGPNEIGKSSIAEALRLIRVHKDSSTHREVKAVRPTHRDAGPQVEIEVQSGDYHFVYTKRWFKRSMTELRVLAPRVDQFTGVEAHERVEQIFAETLDPQLWDALQQVQGESLHQAQLARVGPLQSALATATDESAGGEGDHGDLMVRVENEYALYFTKGTGMPTRDYARAREDLAAIENTVSLHEAALRDIDTAVERHASLVVEKERLERRAISAKGNVFELSAQNESVVALRHEEGRAAGALREARLADTAAIAALAARRSLADEATARRAEADVMQRSAEAHAEASGLAAAALAEHDASYASTAVQVDAARAGLLDAREAVSAARDHAELVVLSDRLAKVADATTRLQRAEQNLAINTLDDAALRDVTDAHTRFLTADAVASSGAARMRVLRLGDVGVSLDGQAVDTVAEHDVTEETTVEVLGVIRVVVTPDEAAGRRGETVAAAQRDLAALLSAHGVADLDEARLRCDARADQVRFRDAARAERDGALAGEDLDVVKGRVAALSARFSAEEIPGDVAALNAYLDEQQRAFDEVEASRLRHDAQRAVLADRVSDARQHDIKARTEADNAQSDASRLEARLASERAISPDDEVARTAQTATDTVTAALGEVERVAYALAEVDADSVETLLSNARAAAAKSTDDLATNDRERSLVEGELEARGRDGIQDTLDEAKSHLEHAGRRHDSLDARAQAAKLLHSTMAKHLARAQQHYVAPFREAIEGLGRVVFGAGFAVDIGQDLAIVSRTLDGVTVPFDSLSGGAKEQLAMIGRLATARLVSAKDGAPVILDDSLGFSDPERRRKLAAVINMVGATAQIIILTCEPERFADIGSARTVALDSQISASTVD